jgi:hypothetical protein
MLTKDCLAEALENISGKTFPEGVLDKCTTTCQLLDEFNNLYKCVVSFSGIIGSTNVSDTMTLIVKDANGNVISESEKNKFSLKQGSYKYSASADGAEDKTDVAFSVTNSDEQKGTKSVVINFTAA